MALESALESADSSADHAKIKVWVCAFIGILDCQLIEMSHVLLVWIL